MNNSLDYPTATSTISGSDSFVMNPKGGAVQTGTYTFAISDLKDQYGVQWPSPKWTENSGYASLETTDTATDSNTLTVEATSTTMSQKTVTITAKSNGKTVATKDVVIKPTYLINFDASVNGGEAAAAVGQQTVVNNTAGATYQGWTIPSGFSASRENWTFVGWNGSKTAKTGIQPGGKINIDSYNDTLYAIFSKELRITYHYWSAGGGAGTAPDAYTIYNKGTSHTFSAPAMKNGDEGVVPPSVTIGDSTYTFIGWREDTAPNSDVSATGSYTVTAGSPVKDVYAVYSTTVTAKFYTYNAAGSSRSVTTKTSTVYVNCCAEAANPNPTTATVEFITASTLTTDNRDFTLDGWRLGDTDEVAATEDTIGANKALALQDLYEYYGVYRGTVTLSYNLNERFADGSDEVTGTVASNTATQYLITDAPSAAEASRTTPAIAINPENVALTRKGADEFLGWAFITENGAEGADTELEGAPDGARLYPTTLAADAAGALHIITDRTLTAIFKDSRKTVECLNPTNNAVMSSQSIRYNYGGTMMAIDPNAVAAHTDKNYHYYFSGWHQINPQAGDIEFSGDPANGYTFDHVRDNVAFSAMYTGMGHDWAKDDICNTPVTCNGLAGDEVHRLLDGGYHRHCTTCGYGANDTADSLSDNTYVVLPTNAADYRMELGNCPPTCMAGGSTARVICKLCYQTLVPAEEIAPLGVPVYKEDGETIDFYWHDMRPIEELEPDYVPNAAYTETKCAVCGHTVREYRSGEHKLIFVAARAATCTEEGYDRDHFLCTEEGCGKRFTDVHASNEILEDVVLPAAGHDWQTDAAGKDPTCAEPGYAPDSVVCANCGLLQDEADRIPALNHPAEALDTEDAVAPTCTEPGKEAYIYCTLCDTVLSGGEAIPATGHKLSGVRVILPTCNEGGRSYRYCENEGCDADAGTEGDQPYEETVSVLDALGHDMKLHAGKAPTCTAAGVKDYYVCTRCDRTTADAEGENVIAEPLDEWKAIDALGHDLGEPEAFAPTCTAAGYSLKKCTRCKYAERTEGDPALGHTGGTATCAAKARCERCGLPYGSFAAHSWDGGVTTEGDCQHRAITTYTCTTPGCGATRQEKGAYGSHDFWVASSSAATCTEQGVTVRRCSVCGEELFSYTDPIGHSVAEWTLDGAVARGVCARCGQTVTTTPGEAGFNHKCEKCGLIHEGRTGMFVQDGLYCKIVGFFRSILRMLGL